LPATAGNAYFPDFALGYGCASWSVRAALALTDTFASRINVRLGYHFIQELNASAYDV
jgi:hypothetical protein